MFIPLHDGRPLRHVSLQWVTLSIIALNVVVHLAGLAFDGPDHHGSTVLVMAFGYVPSVANDLRVLPDGFDVVPDAVYGITALTGAFVHADLWHLGGNMLFLWVFGDNVEDAMGHWRFALFYAACAIGGAWFHAFTFPQSDAALIGASGAASGVIAAYLLLHPKVWVWVLFAARIPLRLPAWLLLGFWLLLQVAEFVVMEDETVSWAAHLGGAMAGLVLLPLLKRRAVPLFDRDIVVPGAVVLEPDAELPPEEEPPRWGRGARAEVATR